MDCGDLPPRHEQRRSNLAVQSTARLANLLSLVRKCRHNHILSPDCEHKLREELTSSTRARHRLLTACAAPKRNCSAHPRSARGQQACGLQPACARLEAQQLSEAVIIVADGDVQQDRRENRIVDGL